MDMSHRIARFAFAGLILLALLSAVIWKGTRLTKRAEEPLPATFESENDLPNAAPFVTDLEKLLQEARYESKRTVEFQAGSALYYVSILRGWDHIIPGDDTQWLVLRDRERKLLEVVSCSINSRLTHMAFGDFISEVLDPPGEDGASFGLRLVIEDERDFGGHFSHNVTCHGKISTYHWSRDRQGGVPAADLKSKGLCRLAAIKDDKFAVLFPSLKEGTKVSRIDE
jgi:hypothetical protein